MNRIDKIAEIEKSITEHESLVDLIGFTDGVLGFSLFYYYHFRFTNREESFDKLVYFLEKALSKINENYKSHKPQIEIMEVGFFLLFLNEKKILDDEQTEEYLLQLDEIIEIYLLKKCTEGDLDFSVGLLKSGLYFIKRNRKQYLLQKILDSINNRCITTDGMVYWEFTLRDSAPIVEIGLAHGVAGVVLFLLNLYSSNFEKENCLALLTSSIEFILAQNRKEGVNWFTKNAFDKEEFNYNNLCYGDIGIGYVVYKSGIVLNNKIYIDEGLLILENASKYRDYCEEYIRDANMIYGASGLYSVFSLLYDMTKSDQILEASDFWFSKILDFNKSTVEDKRWAGFDTYFNGVYEFAQLGFSQGIAGIGIALLAQELNETNDYLTLLNYN